VLITICARSAVLQGPREDSGFSSGVDTGIRLASELYGYIKKFHPKTQVMASGLRTADGALAGHGSLCCHWQCRHRFVLLYRAQWWNALVESVAGLGENVSCGLVHAAASG
jgi:hypothetical protein